MPLAVFADSGALLTAQWADLESANGFSQLRGMNQDQIPVMDAPIALPTDLQLGVDVVADEQTPTTTPAGLPAGTTGERCEG